ncbi:MAG: hypothetical protein LC107_08705 [Chitinophagales bacterium]|nr:hypothetical protein [Chitinophagales bacterium]
MRTLLIMIAITGMMSCAPTLKYYTKDMQDMSGWNTSDLHNIQFYLSNDIVLWRELGKEQVTISNGKIKMTDGRRVEEVVIKKGTPGVFVFSPKDQQYAVSFDSKDDSKYLVFGPSEKRNNRYVLLAKKWDNQYGQVTYGEDVFYTPSESAYAHLMVDMKKVKNISKKRETASGRRVN